MKGFKKGFKIGFKKFGHNISVIINSILLSMVYLVGVGFTSIIAKLFKKNFLETKILRDKETYWSDLNLKKKSMKDYYRQF